MLSDEQLVRTAIGAMEKLFPKVPTGIEKALAEITAGDKEALAMLSALRAVAEAAVKDAVGGEAVAWMTRNEEGDPAMLFFDYSEAATYCDDGCDPEHLYTAPPSREVPEEWKLVPVELNPEMRQAFHDAHDDWQLSLKLASPDHEWSAMLAAAPKPDHSGEANEMVPLNSLEIPDCSNRAVKDSLTADSQQPAAVVELTKCEGCNGHGEVGGLLPGDGGYESNPCPFCQPFAIELTDYELNDISMVKTGYPITALGRVLARAVIAAHIAKQGGAS